MQGSVHSVHSADSTNGAHSSHSSGASSGLPSAFASCRKLLTGQLQTANLRHHQTSLHVCSKCCKLWYQKALNLLQIQGRSREYCCLCSGGTITLADGQRLQYDWLVLALGSSTSFFGIPGVKDLALPFNDFKDAMKVEHSLVMLHVCIGSARSCNSIYHHLAAFCDASCVKSHRLVCWVYKLLCIAAG